MRGYANERDLAPLISEGGFSRRPPVPSAVTRAPNPPPFAPPYASSALPRHASARTGFDLREVERTRGFSAAARRTLDGIGGLGWAVIGFLIGATFWHFVGFWSFVSEVVLAEHSPHRVQETSRPLASMLVEDAALALGASCTALALDRRTGHTSAAGCASGANLTFPVAGGPRADRFVVDSGAVSEPRARRRVITPGKR